MRADSPSFTGSRGNSPVFGREPVTAGVAGLLETLGSNPEGVTGRLGVLAPGDDASVDAPPESRGSCSSPEASIEEAGSAASNNNTWKRWLVSPTRKDESFVVLYSLYE